jgi:PAS domain S-box-containing protein
MPDPVPPPASGDPAPPLAAPRVLIATANSSLRGRIEAALTRAGLTCLTAQTGSVTLEQLNRSGLDLMLVDFHMTREGSQEVLDQQLGAETPVPFIALIDPGEERVGLELMRRGALDCLIKDARWLERVPSVVERALQRLEQQRRLGAAQEALRQSEERFRRVNESGFINIAFFTTDGRITDANDAFLQLVGFSRQELNAGLVRWDELTPPEWLPRTHQAIEQLKATGRINPYEKEYFRRNGSRFWGLFGGAKLEGRSEAVAFVLDISEQKRAEVALRERETQLAFAQRAGRVGVWGLDLASGNGFATQEWCDIVGIPDPALAPNFSEFLAMVHPADRSRLEAANRQALETGSDIALEFRILHPERGERWMLARARRLAPAEGHGHRLLGINIDITEQKRVEEALRSSEERLRFAAQAAGFGCYDLDFVTGRAFRSPEYKALFGVRPDQEFQLDTDQVPVYVHPADRALHRNVTRQSRDPHGSGTKDVEYRVVLPDGTVRWLLVRGRTFFEGEGKARRPVRAIGIGLDVTERRQLEQAILEISGREQRRIGHDLHDDLCQRLGGIQLLSGVLEEELAAEGHLQARQVGRILAQVHEALERARLLARGLAPVGLEAEGLANALGELADNSAQLFRIACEFRAEAPVALADPGAAAHLYRIAQEAITNAVKHGGAKRVVIRIQEVKDAFELKVNDDGRGFAPADAATSGMGLRIMKYRAAMIGATLEVHSAVGRGTTVTCTFGKHLCSGERSIGAM